MKFTMMFALGLLVAVGGTIQAETEETVIDMPLDFVENLQGNGGIDHSRVTSADVDGRAQSDTPVDPVVVSNGMLIVTGPGFFEETTDVDRRRVLNWTAQLLADSLSYALAERYMDSDIRFSRDDRNTPADPMAEIVCDGLLAVMLHGSGEVQSNLVAEFIFSPIRPTSNGIPLFKGQTLVRKHYLLKDHPSFDAMTRDFVAYLNSQGVRFGSPGFESSVEHKIDAIRDLLRAGRFEEGYRQLLPLHYDGVAAASMLLGMMYANADHVDRDIERAMDYLGIASAAGEADATFFLGDLQRESDQTAYAHLMRTAAEQGNIPAAQQIGLAYYHGQGVPKNPVLACKWLLTIQLRTPVADESWTVPLHDLESTLAEDDLTLARVMAWNFVYLDRREGCDQKVFERNNPGFQGRIRADNHFLRDGQLILANEFARDDRVLSRRAILSLKDMLVRDNVYPWTSIDRLAFHVYSVTPTQISIGINSVHLGDTRGDPKTHSTVDVFELDRGASNRTTRWWVRRWGRDDGEYIPYEEFVRIRTGRDEQ